MEVRLKNFRKFYRHKKVSIGKFPILLFFIRTNFSSPAFIRLNSMFSQDIHAVSPMFYSSYWSIFALLISSFVENQSFSMCCITAQPIIQTRVIIKLSLWPFWLIAMLMYSKLPESEILLMLSLFIVPTPLEKSRVNSVVFIHIFRNFCLNFCQFCWKLLEF